MSKSREFVVHQHLTLVKKSYPKSEAIGDIFGPLVSVKVSLHDGLTIFSLLPLEELFL